MMSILLRALLKALRLFRERKALLYSGIYLVSLWAVSTVLFHLLEGPSILDSLYWTITTTATVGYGDIVPKTTIGKVLSMVVMVSGVGVFALFVGSVTDSMVERALKGMRTARASFEGHVVACGWDKRVEIAVRELLSARKKVAVVADVDDIPIRGEDLVFIRGDPTSDEVLNRADVSEASAVLISGKNDVESLLIAISVKKLNERARIVCLVSDPRVRESLRKLGIDQILSIDEFTGLFLSRSVHVPQLGVFLGELMSVRGMDVHQEGITRELEGKKFYEVMKIFKERYEAIPVAIVRGGKVIINPSKEEELRSGDEIIYISEEKLGLEKIG